LTNGKCYIILKTFSVILKNENEKKEGEMKGRKKVLGLKYLDRECEVVGAARRESDPPVEGDPDIPSGPGIVLPNPIFRSRFLL